MTDEYRDDPPCSICHREICDHADYVTKLVAESASLRTQLEEAQRERDDAKRAWQAVVRVNVNAEQQLEAAREQVRGLRELMARIGKRLVPEQNGTASGRYFSASELADLRDAALSASEGEEQS